MSAGADPEDTPPPQGPPGHGGAPVDAHAIAPGAVVGPYTLIRFISEGGMGEVWQAERRDTFRQRVAIKFMSGAGVSPREAIARFEQEREVLAALEHPNIAKIHDGGLHHGRPWFAMEYVDGEPITDFCDRGQGRDVAERLALFRQVCDAVTHAHRRGVIHRDLKPSNILVGTGTGSTPIVKVIDFGIAKAMTRRLTDRTSITQEHRPIGTFEYMSPEQADPGGRDIDTRTDVYSLGVVLYELLSGVKPFDLERRAQEEARRIVLEEDAPTPSVRLSTVATKDSDTALRISKGRREQIQRLIGRLRNELEWIPLMAIRKDRDRRYGSAEDLAKDIENYLQGLPLVAAPESAWYRMRKFGRRHRRALATAAVALAALVATTVVVSVALVERTRALAALEEREAELKGVLTLRDITSELNLATIQALQAMWSSYAQGMESARTAALEALESARERLGPTSDETLQIARAAAVTVAMTGGDLGASERLLREAAEVRGRNGESAGSMEMLTLSFELGRVLRAQGRLPEAVVVLEAAQRAATAERPLTSESRWLVATLLLSMLKDTGADASRLEAQRGEVDALRTANAAAEKPHGCPDWRRLPWHAR